ncbi:MAG: hypothetical protein CBB97_08400 [Candidatus Endolissoclinum sp. TMED37]|nr:MAG: hypothetical protein CBB97_08400 [Candidatus Endolissoclinum sp. TMED37]|tara:strand:+ start:57 stop:1433 length:1377 start_codon:yes stop_codon:yes gene_type:complete
MSYIGKKPVDFNDVTESQTFTVTGDLTVKDIVMSDADTPKITMTDTTNTLTTFIQSGNSSSVIGTSTSHPLRLQTNSTDAIYVDTNQNVGIGTTSPSALLGVNGRLTLGDQASSGTAGAGSMIVGAGALFIQASENQNSSTKAPIVFSNIGGSSESMRIDSSGRLLVGKTTNAIGTAGHTLQADGFFSATRSAAYVAGFNRLSDDGEIVQFFKDGTTVGSINSRSSVVSSFVFDPRSSGSGLSGGTSQIQPTDQNGAVVNNTIDLGSTTTRFKGLYIGDDIAHLDNAGNARLLYDKSSNLLGNAGTNVTCATLSKSSGSFKIDHPLESKSDTHHLVHSFVEAPQADNIYRGTVNLVDGSATINLDTEAGMTEGTFVALNREVQCFTSNESGWTAVKGSVSENTLTITAQDNTCTDTISWLVIGERKDAHMLNTDWTDDNGKVIVEPLKPVDNENMENA